MEQQMNSFLETEKIEKLMRRYSVPCIISLLVAALYNIVDQIFIANADYLGSYGNAANTVVYPLTVVALAIAVMIGDGCCSFVSISLGAKENKKAGGSIGSAVIISVASGLVVTAAYLILTEPILTLFGGKINEQTYLLAKEYFFWITVGIPFYMFGQAMNPIIRSDGSPKYAMVATLTGAVTNIILDPVFIFVFRWGMMGAAVATVLGQVVTAAMSAVYLFGMRAVRLDRESFGLHIPLMKKYLPLGLTSFLSQISLVFSMAAVNNMISKYSVLDPVFSQPEYAQIPMAVIGIVMKFFQIVISISVGTAAGCIPIVGYNIGAKRKDRAKTLFTYLLTVEAAVGIMALLIVELIPGQLIAIFGAANESRYYTDFAIKSFRIYLCLMPLATVNKGTFIYLQSIGKAVASTVISMIREIVLGVGLALLLPQFFGLNGVLYSFPAADIITFAVADFIIVNTYKELNTAYPVEQKEASAVSLYANSTDSSLPVIAIGRSYGAGGRSVGKLIAQQLSIPYYDKEILDSVAEKSGISEKYLASVDEKPARQGIGISPLVSDQPFTSFESAALRLQQETIEEIISRGPCVIVGRRADKLLAESKRPFISIFITAPEDKRIERIADRDGLDLQQAEQKMRKVDKERAAYYNSLSDESWGHAQNYHLCLDTEKLGTEGAAKIAAEAVKLAKATV